MCTSSRRSQMQKTRTFPLSCCWFHARAGTWTQISWSTNNSGCFCGLFPKSLVHSSCYPNTDFYHFNPLPLLLSSLPHSLPFSLPLILPSFLPGCLPASLPLSLLTFFPSFPPSRLLTEHLLCGRTSVRYSKTIQRFHGRWELTGIPLAINHMHTKYNINSEAVRKLFISQNIKI